MVLTERLCDLPSVSLRGNTDMPCIDPTVRTIPRFMQYEAGLWVAQSSLIGESTSQYGPVGAGRSSFFRVNGQSQ